MLYALGVSEWNGEAIKLEPPWQTLEWDTTLQIRCHALCDVAFMQKCVVKNIISKAFSVGCLNSSSLLEWHALSHVWEKSL